MNTNTNLAYKNPEDSYDNGLAPKNKQAEIYDFKQYKDRKVASRENAAPVSGQTDNFDPQKKTALLDAQKNSQQEKARQTLKENNTGKYKGQAAQTIKQAKDIFESATPWGAAAIISKINILSDWPYSLALLAAILKDVLDFTEATGIGYFMVIVFTLLCSIWIAMMMLLADSGKGRRQQKIIRSWLILLSGTTAEMIFGIDILPIETLTVIIIYALTLVDRKQAHE